MNDLLVAQQARLFRLVLIRLTVMAILAAATCLTLRLTGAGNDFPPLDALYFPFVNIVCGVVIWRTFRRYRVSVRDYLGIEGRRLGGDIAWGIMETMRTGIQTHPTVCASISLSFLRS